jgi:glycosyltransferase involved in cell wall biosynthesis
MKICHVVPIYSPGTLFGSSRYVQDISTGLAGKGHDLTVLTANAITGRGWVDPLFGKYSSIREEITSGVKIKRLETQWQITSTMLLLKRIGGWFLPDSIGNIVSFLSAGPYLSNLRKEFQNERYGAIHVTPSLFAVFYLVWRACKALRIPFVCSPFIHFEDPRFKNPLLWKILKEATFVIACTHYEKERMIRMGIDPCKIILVPMGIRLNEWENADGERFRRKYRLKGKKLILFAGPKGYDKGALHLLNAVERLRQKIEDLVLVSIGLPTRMWRKKKRMLDASNLLDLGYLNEEEKKDAFDACDVFVMPSRYDSFGIVYLEAWRCGKPVIGAKIGAISEVIEEDRDGLLVEFGDVEQLTSKMLYLLNHRDLCKEMGENGRRKVVERFNWEKNIEIVENVFERAKIKWR